jgi:hypothetical protein
MKKNEKSVTVASACIILPLCVAAKFNGYTVPPIFLVRCTINAQFGNQCSLVTGILLRRRLTSLTSLSSYVHVVPHRTSRHVGFAIEMVTHSCLFGTALKRRPNMKSSSGTGFKWQSSRDTLVVSVSKSEIRHFQKTGSLACHLADAGFETAATERAHCTVSNVNVCFIVQYSVLRINPQQSGPPYHRRIPIDWPFPVVQHVKKNSHVASITNKSPSKPSEW